MRKFIVLLVFAACGTPATAATMTILSAIKAGKLGTCGIVQLKDGRQWMLETVVTPHGQRPAAVIMSGGPNGEPGTMLMNDPRLKQPITIITPNSGDGCIIN